MSCGQLFSTSADMSLQAQKHVSIAPYDECCTNTLARVAHYWAGVYYLQRCPRYRSTGLVPACLAHKALGKAVRQDCLRCSSDDAQIAPGKAIRQDCLRCSSIDAQIAPGKTVRQDCLRCRANTKPLRAKNSTHAKKVVSVAPASCQIISRI